MTDVDIRPQGHARRSRRRIWITLAAAVLVAGIVGLALFQPWKIFTRNTVDEALPAAAQAISTTQAVTAEQTSAVPTPVRTPTPAGVAAPTSAAAPTEDPSAAAAAPAALPAPAAPSTPLAAVAAAPPAEPQPALMAAGSFVDGEHQTSGGASLLQLPDGSRIVRLEDFSTSDGPDVHVWLTDQPAGGDDWAIYDDGRYLELGELKGTDGNQNYPIPAESDLTGFTSVVIWCDRFNVAFGSAAISI